MRGIKVIDIGCHPEQTTFGTCELCMSYGVANNPYMILDFPDGTRVKVDTYVWDWGDYDEYGVDNIVDFSAWLSEQDLTDDEVSSLKGGSGIETLVQLIDDYNAKQTNLKENEYGN